MNPEIKHFNIRKHQYRRSLVVGSTSRPLSFHNVRMVFTSVPFKQMNVKSKTMFTLNVRKIGKNAQKKSASCVKRSMDQKMMVIVVPFPGSLCRSMFAWCSCAPCFTMDSPRPVPPMARLRLLSTR